jgi:hypothetical protein
VKEGDRLTLRAATFFAKSIVRVWVSLVFANLSEAVNRLRVVRGALQLRERALRAQNWVGFRRVAGWATAA